MDLGLECFNPLWQKDQITLLWELLKSKFEIIISGVAAYPLDKEWVRKKIDSRFIKKSKVLADKYKINPSGEGGEFESLVLNCPLFKAQLNLKDYEVLGSGNSWRINL